MEGSSQLSIGAAAWIPAGCTQARYQVPSELMFGNGKPSWLPVYIVSFEADGSSAIFTLEWDPSIKIKTFLKDTLPRQINENVEDLSALKFVNEGAVVQNLTRRFVDNQFFTSIGRSVYVSVNPIHRLVRSSGGHRNDTTTIFSHLDRLQKSPHVYHAADQLYRGVVEDLRSQTVIVRGMSGSGKTECFKHIAQYMINADGHRNPQEAEYPTYEPLGTFQNPLLCNGTPISKGLTAWTAVLELFGTAQTERNECSSRHSKVLNFHYGHDGHIQNIDMICLMLETSRVLLKDPTQRPFKIFQILVSATIYTGRSEAESGLFAFTSNLQESVKGGKSYHAKWESQCAEALSHIKSLIISVGVTEEQWQGVLQCVAAVMHLQCLVVSGSDSASISMTTKSHVGFAERLLGMENGHLMPLLLCKSTDGSMAGKSTNPLTPSEIKMLIDGMSAEIYSRVLYFLLAACSKCVSAGAFEKMKAGEMRAGPMLQLIEGFGYENIAVESGATPNGLMQFCVNTLEERLQEKYLERVFKSELDFLISEGLPPIGVCYAEVETVLSVLDRPPSGVMSLVEEASLFPRGSDNSLLDKVFSAHSKTRLIKSAGRAAKQSCFVVKHNFGDITYDTDGFTVCNKTKAPQEVIVVLNNLTKECLASSGSTSSEAAPVEDKKSGPGKLGVFAKNSEKAAAKSGLMATKFRDGIGILCQAAERDPNPVYILCIKSSSDAKGFTVDPDLVTPQIKYLAVTELSQFSKESFPYRKNYREFYERYRPMLGFNAKDLPRKLGINDNHQAMCKGLLRSCAVVAGLAKIPEGIDGPMFGETNIFLRTQLVDTLEESRFQTMQRYSQAAVMLQSLVRKFIFNVRFRKMKRGTVRMQAVARKAAARKVWIKTRTSALIIKSVYMTRKYRRHFNAVRNAVAIIKSRLLGKMIIRLRYKRIQKAVKMMHFLARGFVIRQQANHVVLAVLVIQRAAADFLLRNRLFYRRDNAVVTLQRSYRGWIVRLDNAPEVNTLTILRNQRRAHRTVRSIQANFRRKLTIRRYNEVYHAASVLQMWCRARRQRKQFIQIQQLNLWLQSAARRVIANNRVNGLRLIIMMKEEFDHLKEVRDKELSLLKRDSSDPAATPQIGGGFYQDGHGKFVRFMFGFDVLLDTEEAYPKGWVKEVLEFDKQLRKQGQRRLAKIAVGSTHTVLIDSMSNVYTFGMGDEGQLGHGSRHNESTPRLVETLVYQASVTEAAISRSASVRVDVQSVCAGRDHTLLLTKTGRVYSWGNNRRGQLGHSNFQSSALPRMVGGMVKNAKIISCGAYHSAALVDPGIAFIWGAKECLGCGGSVMIPASQKSLRTKPTTITDISEPRSIPFFSKRRVQEVICGDTCTFAQSNGELYTWGNNNYGQLGTGNRLNRAEPVLVPMPAVVKSDKITLSVGGRHSVMLIGGTVFAWGWNKWGQVDGGVTENDVLSPVPVNLEDAMDPIFVDSPKKGSKSVLIVQVTAGWRHSTALTSTGEVIAWGRAGLLFDSREEQSTARDDVASVASSSRSRRSEKQRSTIEEELKAAAYLSPAPTKVNLPSYAAADRVLKLFDCHSPAISISAVEILFRDTIKDKDIKIAKYVSKRETNPILYHTGGVKQKEYSQRFREVLGSSMGSTVAKSKENGSDSVSNISVHDIENSDISAKYLRLNSDSFKRSPNSKKLNKSSAIPADTRQAQAAMQRDREGVVTEEGLLSLFSPLRQRRRANELMADDESDISLHEMSPSAIPFQASARRPSGGDSKSNLAPAPSKDLLQRQRSLSLHMPQQDGGNSLRRSSLSISAQNRKGALEVFAERQLASSAEEDRRRSASPPKLSKAKSSNSINQQQSEVDEAGGVAGGLSLSAVTDLAAMIQSIKKESLQNMTMQWRY